MDREVVDYYEECGSVRQTAKKFKISQQKVRKILISAGVYKNETSVKIKEMYDGGQSIESIALELKLSTKCVHSYLPYTKGEYITGTPSVNAMRIKECRERKIERQK